MKKLLSLIALSLCILCANSFGQSNSIPANDTSQLTGGFSKIAGDFGAFLTDAQPYFGTNGNTLLGLGAIESNGKWGALADVTVFSLATNNQVTLGFAAAYLDGQWYDASLALKAGTTWKVPLLGAVYTSVESGPGYNFKQGHVLAQNFALVTKGFTLWKINWSVFAGMGNISDRPGLAKVAGVNGNFKF